MPIIKYPMNILEISTNSCIFISTIYKASSAFTNFLSWTDKDSIISLHFKHLIFISTSELIIYFKLLYRIFYKLSINILLHSNHIKKWSKCLKIAIFKKLFSVTSTIKCKFCRKLQKYENYIKSAKNTLFQEIEITYFLRLKSF